MEELFPVWRHHAVFTDSPFEFVQAEEQHRGHASVEQVFADATSGRLGHLSSAASPPMQRGCPPRRWPITWPLAADALTSLAFAKARAATIRRDCSPSPPAPPATEAAASPSACPKAGTASRNG